MMDLAYLVLGTVFSLQESPMDAYKDGRILISVPHLPPPSPTPYLLIPDV